MDTQAASAIQRLKHVSCFAIDDGDYERWVSLFTEDGRLVVDGDDTFEGNENLYAFAAEVFDTRYDHTAHVATTPAITVDDDTATGRWYLMLFFRDAEGNDGWQQARYDDEYRRVDGAWRIAEARVDYGLSHEL